MNSASSNPAKGDKRRVRQSPNRAAYDRESLYKILDASLIGHVAFTLDDWPQSIPTAIARIDDHLYLHGSRSSRLFKFMAAGNRVCVSVCLVDALLKARSAFHCSMNYRSAVIFGCGEVVSADEKMPLLDQFTERLIPGSIDDYREPLAKEIKATELIRLPLDETSAKIRTGDPVDDDEDVSLPHWAGIIPLRLVPGEPFPSENLPSDVAMPEQLKQAISRLQGVYAGE